MSSEHWEKAMATHSSTLSGLGNPMDGGDW